MKIHIPKVPEEGYWVDEEIPINETHLNFPHCRFLDPIGLHLFISKVSGELLVRGDLQTRVHIVCSRCLNDFIYPVDLKEFTFCEVIENRLIIDLTGSLEEDIMLTLPAKPLCRENCKGLCPQCGKDWNEKVCSCKQSEKDVRLSDLNKLKFD